MDAEAPCCSRDFMSLTVASLVLAMSIALSSFNLSSFPKRTSCTFRSQVPIINCSIKRSSSSASLNRHFWARILHLARNESTLSPSACLKPYSWYLAIRKFDLGSRYAVNLLKIASGFAFSSSVKSKELKIFWPSSPTQSRI